MEWLELTKEIYETEIKNTSDKYILIKNPDAKEKFPMDEKFSLYYIEKGNFTPTFDVTVQLTLEDILEEQPQVYFKIL